MSREGQGAELLDKNRLEKQLQDNDKEFVQASSRRNIKRADKLIDEKVDLLLDQEIVDEAEKLNKKRLVN